MQNGTGALINLADVKAGIKAKQVTTDEYFGGCPHCGKSDGYINVQRSHFYICKTHQVYWPIGANLFSSWQYEDQATWDKNAQMLERFTEVEPIRPEFDSPAEPPPFDEALSALRVALGQFIASAPLAGSPIASALKNQVESLRLLLDMWEREDIPFGGRRASRPASAVAVGQ